MGIVQIFVAKDAGNYSRVQSARSSASIETNL